MSVVKVSITPTQWLAPAAAEQYARMIADGCPSGVTSAGRTTAEQAALYARYLRDLATGRKPPRQASPPGSARAHHVDGTAIDLPEPARSWVRAHGAAYGWHADRVPGEPWHFEFSPTASTQEDDMPLTEQDVLAVAHAVWTTQIDRGAEVSTKQDMADTGTIARQILAAVQSASAPVIDYDALAAKIPAPKIDYAALAKAVNDDAARRMQG